MITTKARGVVRKKGVGGRDAVSRQRKAKS